VNEPTLSYPERDSPEIRPKVVRLPQRASFGLPLP
jgi:hypothetical protein